LHGFAVVNPRGDGAEIVAKVGDGGGFHGATGLVWGGVMHGRWGGAHELHV
jgi:hypothetical protein